MGIFPGKEQIGLLLRNEVSPLLRSHGGDLILLEVADPVIKVRLTGACFNCMGASETIENIVQKTLRDHFRNEQIQVILSNEVSRELIEEAKRILKKEKRMKV